MMRIPVTTLTLQLSETKLKVRISRKEAEGSPSAFRDGNRASCGGRLGGRGEGDEGLLSVVRVRGKSQEHQQK